MSSYAASRNTYDSNSYVSPTSIAVYAVISALLIYHGTLLVGCFTRSASEMIWNLLVYAMPARLLFALDPMKAEQTASSGQPPSGVNSSFDLSRAKSEAMSRILGFRSNHLLGSFKRARAMSGFGNTYLAAKDEAPPGLGNWDNSCYQNSVIQGFASLHEMSKFLDRNISTLGYRGDFHTQRALKGVIERLNDPESYGRTLWTPSDLKSMSSWQQQDAQEYLSKVVDQMDKEIVQGLKGRTDNEGLKQLRWLGDVTKQDSSAIQVELASPRDKTFPTDKSHFQNPLEGLLAHRVGCMQCGYSEGLSLIPFNCLTVPLGTAWKQDIRDCFDEYTALEPIEGVECGKCTLLKSQEQLNRILQQIENELKLQEDDGPRVSDALKESVEQRLQAVGVALDEQDFSETTLSKKCHIPSRNRVSTTKSRQAVIARAPKSLVVHVNRSMFDETTGIQRKNYADVQFPETLDLSEWCLGLKYRDATGSMEENWELDPSKSMLNLNDASAQDSRPAYELRAVITHFGRHENGHYICYRKYPTRRPSSISAEPIEAEEKIPTEQWWRLSDEDVTSVTEADVLDQGGVFMLFYEVMEGPSAPERIHQQPVASISDSNSLPLSPQADTVILTETDLLPGATRDPPRSDTPNTVIDLRIDRLVPSSPDVQGPTPEILDTETEDDTLQEGKPRSRSPSPSTSASSTPPRRRATPPSFPHVRTLTPVMRTSSLPEKNASPHHKHPRNAPSMVTAV